MKKEQVKIGTIYRCKVSGNVVDVRITGEDPHGGWQGVNALTNRKVRVKSAQRLRAVSQARPAKRKTIMSLAEYEDEAKAEAAAPAAPAEKAGKATKDAMAAKGRDTGEPGAALAKPTDDGQAKPKRLSALDGAVKILEERDPADGPLSCAQMIERMAAAGYWTPIRGGLTPANTLYASILREIKAKGEDSRFEKMGRGRFTLSLKR